MTNHAEIAKQLFFKGYKRAHTQETEHDQYLKAQPREPLPVTRELVS